MAALPAGWQNPYPELTEKQGRFVCLVVLDGNGSKAARDAGYSKSSAGALAAKLLKNGRVAKRIEELRAELRDRHSATADNIIERYRKMAMGDAVSLVVIDSDTGLSRFKTSMCLPSPGLVAIEAKNKKRSHPCWRHLRKGSMGLAPRSPQSNHRMKSPSQRSTSVEMIPPLPHTAPI